MGASAPVTITCLLVLMSAPALAASPEDREDCASNDPDRVSGCTRIIQDPAESVSSRAGAYIARGLIRETRADIGRAIGDFTEAIKLDPKLAVGYSSRGHALVAKRDLDRAIVDLDEAVRLDPKLADAYFLRGAVRYDLYMGASAWVDQKDLDRAIADFTEVVRLDAKNAAAYYARGLSWYIDGRRERAVADLTEAVRLDPENPDMIAFLKQLSP